MPAAPFPPRESRARILLVEDDEALAYSLERTLSGAGFEVSAVGDGGAALGALAAADADVVLLDLRLPDISGPALLKGLREIDPSLQIVVLTGYPTVEHAVAGLREGAFEFLVKPAPDEDLLAAINRGVSLRRSKLASARLDAARALFAAPDWRTFAANVTRIAREALNADDATLMIADDERRELRVEHAERFDPDRPDGAPTVIRYGEGIAGRVALERTAALVNGPAAMDPRFRDVASDPHVATSIVYPLTAQRRLLAVLSINRRGEGRRCFRLADLELASNLCAHLALALENRLLAAAMVERERLAVIGELAAGVAHELNNPLSFLLSAVGVLREELRKVRADPAPARWDELEEVVQDLVEGGLRLKTLVKDIKGLARREECADETFDLCAAADSALRVSKSALVGVRVEKHYEPEAWVRGAEGRMVQVFINLIVNAGHAMEKRNPGDRLLTLRVARDGVRVVAEVADNGQGMSAEVQARIFEPFFTTKGNGGTGLGLAITKGIVLRHGGAISVESQPGVGTRFRMSLPAAEVSGGTKKLGVGPPL